MCLPSEIFAVGTQCWCQDAASREHLLAVLHLAELARNAFLFSAGPALGLCYEVAESFEEI